MDPKTKKNLMLYKFWTYLDYFLTRPVALTIGRILMPVLGFVKFHKQRRAVKENLKVITGSVRITVWEVLKVFSNYGTFIADYFLIPFMSKKRILNLIPEHSGMEHLDSALKRGKGVILLSAHIGNWEYGGVLLSQLGYDINVVGLIDPENAGVTEYRDWAREKNNIKVVNRDKASLIILDIYKLLQKNEIVAMLGDRVLEGSQAIQEDGVDVEFFGYKVSFPAGYIKLAFKTGASIIPCFVVLERRKYKACSEEPISFDDTLSEEENIRKAAQQVASVFEKYIRKYPHQWYTWYSYWKSL